MCAGTRTTGFRRISAAIVVGNPGLSKTTYPSEPALRGNLFGVGSPYRTRGLKSVRSLSCALSATAERRTTNPGVAGSTPTRAHYFCSTDSLHPAATP